MQGYVELGELKWSWWLGFKEANMSFFEFKETVFASWTKEEAGMVCR